MWARVAELILAAWLGVSPYLMTDSGPSAVDLAMAALVGSAALLCFWPRLSRLHLATLASASALVALGFAAGPEGTPVDQSRLVVGLLLLMFAVVPSHASRPPGAWARQLAAEEEKGARPAESSADGAPGPSI